MAANLEISREACEEIEALELALVEELESVTRKSHKSKLAQELRIRNILRAAKERAARVQTGPVKPQGGLSEFYRKKQLLDDFTKTNVDVIEMVESYDAFQIARTCALGGEMHFEDEEDERKIHKPKNRLERREARARIDEFVLSHESFTGEEQLGRFLDLHEHHLAYQNLHDSFAKVSYLDYLRAKLTELPPALIHEIRAQDYAQYLKGLLDYVIDFRRRAMPIAALGLSADGATDAMDDGDAANNTNGKPFETELKRATSAADLEKSLTLPQLKQALEARGLKASGTAVQRAARLFAVKNLQPDEYPLELLSTSQPASNTVNTSDTSKDEERLKKLFAGDLRPFIQATITTVTKKLTMTFEEIAQELKEEEKELEEVERSDEEDSSNEDEEDRIKANGVIDPTTGRLIPKWKYKLFGLNQEFKCEICGGHTYFGRKAYDKHFKDYRHANGMRALGIPNTAHFHDITSIEDAKMLYESLKKDLERGEFNQFKEEEFEDNEGNVLSKLAYEDLKREGLL